VTGEGCVSPDSQTEKLLALKLSLDNWGWQDVPFYLRRGKRLTPVSQGAIQFRAGPHQAFPPEATLDWQPARLLMSIHPDEGILLRFQAKHPGPQMHLRTLEMQFNYQDAFAARSPDADVSLESLPDRGTGTSSMLNAEEANASEQMPSSPSEIGPGPGASEVETTYTTDCAPTACVNSRVFLPVKDASRKQGKTGTEKLPGKSVAIGSLSLWERVRVRVP
jgi:hypothetical protein